MSLVLAALACIGDAAAQEPEDDDKTWDIRLGIGAALKPDYDGSDNYELKPLPIITVVYRDTIFLRVPVLGANVVNWTLPGESGRLRLGPLVRYQSGRDEKDNRALRGLGDIDRGIEAGGFVVWSRGGLFTLLTVLQDVTDSHNGLVARLEAGQGFRITPQLRGRAAAWATVADDKYMRSFFGITPGQSARSGLAPHRADAGFKDVGLGLTMEYAFTENWRIAGRLSYHRLLGDAASSPIVKGRGSPDQFLASLYLFYRF